MISDKHILQNFKKQLKHFFSHKLLIKVVLFLGFVGCSWAIFHPSFFRVHDFTQGARIAEMKLALAEGHFPVRWSQNFGYGFGMPLFEFYGPLPYYLAGFLYWLGLDLIFTIKLLVLLANLLTVLGSYLLGYRLSKLLYQKLQASRSKPDWTKNTFLFETAGLVLSLALSLAPYRAVNLYIRGAFAEIWGLAALPWILWSMVLIVDQQNSQVKSKNRTKSVKPWLSFSLSLFVLFTSHNITTLIFAPFALIFGLILLILVSQKNGQLFTDITVTKIKKMCQQAQPQIMSLFKGSLLALGLASFYLWPSFFEKEATKLKETILGGYFDFHLHFLYLRQFFQPNWGFGGSQWGPNDGISFFLGWGQLFGLGLVILSVILISILKLFKKVRGRKLQWFKPLAIVLGSFLTLMLIAILFSTQKTVWIWEQVALLEFVQFPWRFMVIITLFLSVVISLLPILIALILKTLSKTQFEAKLVYGSGLLVIGLILISNFYFFRPEKYLDNAQDYYYASAPKIRDLMSQILPDYIPAQMADELNPAQGLILNQANLDMTKVQVLLTRPHQKLVKTNFTQPQTLAFAVADFPGWEFEIDGQFKSKQVGQIGNLEVQVPAGEHLVGLKFAYTQIRLLSDLVSALSFMIVLSLIMHCHKENLAKKDF